MTRTLNDPTTTPSLPATGAAGETAPEGLAGDALHHPPKPATMGLDPDNQAESYVDRGETRSAGGVRPASDQRSIGELIKELRDESIHLVRQELNLAKTEMSEKASFFGKQAGKLGAGGAVLAVGSLLLLTAVACGVAWIFQRAWEWLPTSALAAGYFIVGAVVTLVGYSLYKSAMNKMRNESLTPERTLQSLKDDKQWLTHKTTETTR